MTFTNKIPPFRNNKRKENEIKGRTSEETQGFKMNIKKQPDDIEGWPDNEPKKLPKPRKKNPEERKFPMLDDVIGQEEAKKRAQDVLTGFKKGELLDYYGVTNIKGMLLHGPPGTGKTMLVEAMTNESDMMFFPLDLASVGDIYVNSGVRNIMSTYDAILQALHVEEQRLQTPQYAVIYLDECETILGKRRGNLSGVKEDDKVVNTLCEIIDGPYKSNKVFFVATSNRKELIDEAFLRAGRFEVHIELPPPEQETREKMFQMYAERLRKKDGNLNFRGLDYKKLADMTNGYVGADIAHVMREGIRNVVFNNLNSEERISRELYVTQKRLEDALTNHKPIQYETNKTIDQIGFTRQK